MDIDPLEAIRALASKLGGSNAWGQVRVERVGEEHWRLLHASDDLAHWASFQPLTVAELREWGDRTEHGKFRALRSAPNLRRGWRCEVSGLASLEDALNRLYPGSVADWWAWEKHGAAATTGFREFVGRQTGMYRTAQRLSERGAKDLGHACCGMALCCKLRAWTVDSSGTSGTTDALRIPCLEPCAVALEFARQAAKLESGPQMTLTIPEAEFQTLMAGLKIALSGLTQPGEDLAEGALGDPGNPRRIELLLQRIRPELQEIARASSE